MNKETIVNLKEDIKKKFSEDLNLQKLNDLKVEYLGKTGIITELSKEMKNIANEDKKEFGKLINELREEFNNFYEETKEKTEKSILDEKLSKEKIDISLPSTNLPVGAPNILELVIEEVEELLMSMGYDVVDGPEIEEDKYNFELLNIPKGHPARDAQDTFYIEDEKILLRSQTSPMQVRTMLKGEGKTPIRMICPGKTYRRDDDDATHSHQFMQIEGLLVDKNISLSDLKGTFDVIAKKLFGPDCVTRFRPSYYQFTEPSVETDISCFNCVLLPSTETPSSISLLNSIPFSKATLSNGRTSPSTKRLKLICSICDLTFSVLARSRSCPTRTPIRSFSY